MSSRYAEARRTEGELKAATRQLNRAHKRGDSSRIRLASGRVERLQSKLIDIHLGGDF